MNRSAALLALLLGAEALGQSPGAAGPPDPRRGERLDSRPTPEDPLRAPRAVASGALAVPRWLIEALFWPVVRVAATVERHHVVARTYWAFTSEDGLVGLRPEANYETGLLTSLGLRLFDRRSLGPGSLVEVKARTAGPDYLYGELRLRAPVRSPVAVELRTLFERNPERLFAGTHGERRAALLDAGRGLAFYHTDRALDSLSLSRAIAGLLLLELRGELDLRVYRSSGTLDAFYCAAPATPSCTGVDDALVPGFHEGLRIARGQAVAILDTRRGRRRVGGVRIRVDGTLAHGVLGDPSAHARMVADARAVLDLSDRALILRVDAGLVTPLGDAPVPFDELLSPSGNEGLRGLSTGRLRGQSQLFGSLEYRWLLAPYLDAALFVDLGGAFDRGFAGVALDRMIPSYGFGLRVHEIRGDYWNAAPLLWLQVAHAPGEGTRLLVTLGGGD